jgi:dTDP-4-dehydrorhamnose 3,5-epimerase
VLYKATEYWIPEYDRCIRWNDPDIAIDWPLADGDPVLSDRDAGAPGLRDAEVYA